MTHVSSKEDSRCSYLTYFSYFAKNLSHILKCKNNIEIKQNQKYPTRKYPTVQNTLLPWYQNNKNVLQSSLQYQLMVHAVHLNKRSCISRKKMLLLKCALFRIRKLSLVGLLSIPRNQGIPMCLGKSLKIF